MDTVPGSYMQGAEPSVASETSVETALNSRCSSDRDGDPAAGHWGMYDSDEPVPPENLHALERAVQIPRFTYYRLDVDFDERPIVLSMAAGAAGVERDWLHVESGMQQQAVHLVCAALGMGTCIYNMGVEGRRLSGELWGNVRMGIEMMRPSFGGSVWTTRPPDDCFPDPSLPEPRREGGMPLLEAVEDLATSAGGRDAEWDDISQLLWAARGRTPHLYGGRRWGLTIPTWAGRQDIGDLYLVTREGAFRYVNRRDDRPTHSLERIGGVPEGFGGGEYARAVMAINEQSGRALWEVGYMLENLLAQAASLHVQYRAKLLDPVQAATYAPCGFEHAVATLSVYRG